MFRGDWRVPFSNPAANPLLGSYLGASLGSIPWPWMVGTPGTPFPLNPGLNAAFLQNLNSRMTHQQIPGLSSAIKMEEETFPIGENIREPEPGPIKLVITDQACGTTEFTFHQKLKDYQLSNQHKRNSVLPEGLIFLDLQTGGKCVAGIFCAPGHQFKQGDTVCQVANTTETNWTNDCLQTEDPQQANLSIKSETETTVYSASTDIESGNEIQLFISQSQPSTSEERASIPDIQSVNSDESKASDTTGSSGIVSLTESEEIEKNPIFVDSENAGYQCERCGKVFSYQYYRDKHLKYTRCVDKGDRKFPCHLCSRSFEKRDRLRIHILHVHEKHRPHCCSICGKRFSQSSSLNKHLRVHSGERPYKCAFCGKAFTASSILRTHIRQHSGEKPFKCKFCGKAFASHAAHDSHVRRTHSTVRAENHACLLCGKAFQHSSHLKFHLQCIHGSWTALNGQGDT